MEKPITIVIEDFKNKITNEINNSNLHPFILDAIFKDLYNEIHNLYNKQIIDDKISYKEFVEKQNESLEQK